MERTAIVALALMLAGALSYFDKALPAEAWAAVGLLLGAGVVRRPGDAPAHELVARELEQDDPTPTA